jgi:dienelactone hydrolase
VLDEAREWLASDDIDWAHTDGVGLLGIELGGRFALIESAHRDWVAAVAIVYTPLTGDEDRRHPVAGMLQHVARPVLGLYGAEDELIAPETVDEAQNRNPSGQWLLYEGARHGFLNESNDNYEQASAEDAITRVVEFFRSTLPAAAEQEVG